MVLRYMVRDVEPLFMDLLVIHNFFGKMSVEALWPFLNGIILFCFPY